MLPLYDDKPDGESFWALEGNTDCMYSTRWNAGGPIIEREKIGVGYTTEGGATWLAAKTDDPFYISGPTPLVAAMRCYVASKLGDTVDIPEELT